MCGIAGIFLKNQDRNSLLKFREKAMLSKHRGPDHTGYMGGEKHEFVHHRLSIIDLDPRSNQPFFDESTQNTMVYNGEIYNFRDIAKSHNLNLKTQSDTEVLFQLLQKDDVDFNLFNGIFAFGFFNKGKSRLTLGRDRYGVKPLYYYATEDLFMFASEAKVIYNYLDELQINFQALSEFIRFGSSISCQTIVSGVKKLEPGSILTLNTDDLSYTQQSFWSIGEFVLDQQIKPSYKDAKVNTRRLLENAIERQCISDVEVGAYLSGGIDSSAVVALASKFTEKKLKTYSVDFVGNPHSELKNAAEIAKIYNTDHHEFTVSTAGIEEYLSDIIFQYDEPFADPAMIPLHLMANKAAKFSSVVLQGDGGDEIFAGYGRHLDLMKLNQRKTIFSLLQNVHYSKKQRELYKSRFDQLNEKDFASLMAGLVGSSGSETIQNYFSLDYGKHLLNTNPIYQYELRNKAFDKLHPAQKMLYTDMEIILPHTFMEKSDKINMYHSIESRVPLLDNELSEYVMKLPVNYKIRKGITKSFFREVVSDLIPEHILYGRKRSFGTPMIAWMKTTLHDFAIAEFNAGKKAGLPINYDFVFQQMLDLKAGKIAPENVGILWRLLVLNIWLGFYKDKLSFS